MTIEDFVAQLRAKIDERLAENADPAGEELEYVAALNDVHRMIDSLAGPRPAWLFTATAFR